MSSNTAQLSNIYVVFGKDSSRIYQINVYRQDNQWVAGCEEVRGYIRSNKSAYAAAKLFALSIGVEDDPMEVQLPSVQQPREPTELEKFGKLLCAYAAAHADSVNNPGHLTTDPEAVRLDHCAGVLVQFVNDLINENNELKAKVSNLETPLAQFHQRIGAQG